MDKEEVEIVDLILKIKEKLVSLFCFLNDAFNTEKYHRYPYFMISKIAIERNNHGMKVSRQWTGHAILIIIMLFYNNLLGGY